MGMIMNQTNSGNFSNSIQQIKNEQSGTFNMNGPGEKEYQWFRDARFGVFIHWSPASVIALGAGSWQREGNDHYKGSNKTTHGQLPEEIKSGVYIEKYAGKRDNVHVPQEVYDNLYQVFNPYKFDAEAVADMIKQSGAKYVVFTAKHHDGFCMFNTSETEYNIMNTPYGKDIAEQLAGACHNAGIELIWYYSKADWYDPRYSLETVGEYKEFMRNQVEELSSEYGKIKGFWWDGGGEIPFDGTDIYKAIYKHQPGAIYNNRGGLGLPGIEFGTPEQKLGHFNREYPWESCITLQGEAWFWDGGRNLRSVKNCLRLLIDAAAGDGNLLLDFGLTGEGEIYAPIKEIYLKMGEWLKKYGETIYGTRGGPYKPSYWGGSTCRENIVYLHITQKWPGGCLHLPQLPAEIVSASSLTGGIPEVSNDENGLTLFLPEKYHDETDTIIKLELDRNAFDLMPVETKTSEILTIDAEAEASSHMRLWGFKGYPGSVIIKSCESGAVTTFYGEEEQGEEFSGPTQEEKEKYPWLKLERGHVWRYWMADPDDRRPWLTVSLKEKKRINRIHIAEKFNRIHSFELEYMSDEGWKRVLKAGELGLLSFLFPEPVVTDKVRIRILEWASDDKGEGPGIQEVDLIFDPSA